MFLKNNDAAVFEEIQGLALNGTSHYRSWPRLGGSSERLVRRESTKATVKVDDEKLGNSPYAAIRKTDSRLLLTSNIHPAKKTYSQLASSESLLPKTVTMDKEKISLKSSLQPSPSVDTVTSTSGKEKRITSSIRSPRLSADQLAATQSTSPKSSLQTRKPLNMDPNLTFIDWGDSSTNRSSSAPVPVSAKCIARPANTIAESYDTSRLSESVHPETILANKYHNMYQEEEGEDQSSTRQIIPAALRDKMSLITAQLPNSSPAVFTQEERDGTRYTTVQTTLKDDRMTRTQTSVYYPRNYEQESNCIERKCSGLKSVCIAGATEIKDERLDLSKRANCNAEAFCRTTNHVGIFTLSGLDSRRKSEVAERAAASGEVPITGEQGARGTSSSPSSQLAICLPGSMVRRQKQHLSTAVGSESGRTCEHEACESMQDMEKEEIIEGSFRTENYQTRGVKGLRAVYIAGCPEITDGGVQVSFFNLAFISFTCSFL
ncbi:hypothetical protein R1flu_003779 [Riccia fluitans]|uniref:Uncharacterized protein n=1 Tax=Riccia fluitans TaxID=41844 RepID=A0ABD1YAY6_9MARC